MEIKPRKKIRPPNKIRIEDLTEVNSVYDQTGFLSCDPTQIGETHGIKFYEHPVYGDEAPLVAVYKRACFLTNWEEMPDKGYEEQIRDDAEILNQRIIERDNALATEG